MDERKFIQIAISTWIVGLSVALLLILNDYSAFARARETGVNNWTTRIDALDELFREALRVESALKIDYSFNEDQLVVFSNELTVFSGKISDYKSQFTNAGMTSFPDVVKQVEEAEKALEKLLGKMLSLTSMAESMLGNKRQANEYRNQARILRAEARRNDNTWYWGAAYSLYTQAQAIDHEAQFYDDNADRIQANIGAKRAEIRSQASEVRRNLSVTRADCEKAAEQSYMNYLKAKSVKFGRKHNTAQPDLDSGRSRYMRRNNR